jgi:hypothetical protein
MALELLTPHVRRGAFAAGISQRAVHEKLAEIGLQSLMLENLYGWHNGFAPTDAFPQLFGMVFEPLETGIELFQMLRTIEADIPAPGWFGLPTWFPIFRIPDHGIVLLDTVNDCDLYLHDRDYGVNETSTTMANFFQALIDRATSQPDQKKMKLPNSWCVDLE